MSNAVPLLAAALALAAAAVRLPRWRVPESRPFTVGIALLALWAILRTPAVNRPANELTLPGGHFGGLPGLAADVALVAAGGLIGVAVADAWGRPVLKKAFYVGLIVVEATLLLTYDPTNPTDRILDTHLWILAIAGIVGNAAVLVAALLSYRDVPERFRLPLGLFIAGGVAGLVLAVIRVVTLVRPTGAQVEAWAPVVSIPIFAFSIGSLIASARMRRAPDREPAAR
ncbi:hypothetical protein [Nocardia sp. IFM 10818]